jgi:hypothetical protein
MAKYALLYKGGGDMPQSDEEREQVTAAWGAWFEGLGTAVLDAGNPFGPSASVGPDGSAGDGAASGVTGYSIVSAADLGGATEMAKGCPILAAGGGVEVHEIVELM